MTPEQTLLLRCATPYPNQEQIEQIRQLLHSPLYWPEITAQANKHGISQLLFHTVQQIDRTAVPEAVQAKLQRRFDRAIRHNLLLTGELLRLIHLLAEAGITAVPFKGPVLAEELYGSLALRVFVDLDILIHMVDRDKVRALLIANGFTPHFHPDSAYQFIKADPQIILEVHWEAISFGSDWLRKLKNKPLPATLAHLTPRLTETRLGGKVVSTLSPEDAMLILTIHGSKHWWSRLNWLSDIAALIHVHPDLDWDWLMEQANYWKIRRLVFLGLHLADTVLEIKLPDPVKQQIQTEPQIEKLSRQVQSMFFIEQNFYTRYIKRPAYFRRLWDTGDERRTLYVDHLSLYLELFTNLIKSKPLSRK
jgi:hypothetical protein